MTGDLKTGMTRRAQSSKELLRTRPFVIDEVSYLHPSGKEIVRTVVRHPGAVVMLPIDNDGRVVLVRQYRWSVDCALLELPAGTREINEEPLATAKRELAEEIGKSATEWISLGELFPAPGFCDEKQFIFLAKGLSEASAEGDEDEEIEVVHMTIEELDAAIRENQIQDGKTLATILLARSHGLI